MCFRFDAVIHFAAFKAVGESSAKPLEYYDNNFGGSVSLMQVMRDHGCKNVSVIGAAAAAAAVTCHCYRHTTMFECVFIKITGRHCYMHYDSAKQKIIHRLDIDYT